MKTTFYAVLLASSTALAASHLAAAAPPHFVHHQWRIVDLMQDGRFRFQGSDNVTYYYALDDISADHFQKGDTTDSDGIYFLPQGGHWTHSGKGLDQSGTVAEEERTVIYFDASGSPADGQIPPTNANSADGN